MRTTFALTLTVATGAIALLPACAGNSAAPPPLLPNAAVKPAPGWPVNPLAGNSLPYLFVADPDNVNFARYGDVQLFHNTSYKSSGVISAALNTPWDVFMDGQSNLYAANFGELGSGAGVTEYAPDSYGDPLFTYSAGLNDPTAVAVDSNGNVFVAQFSMGGSLPGDVSEYSQQVNTVFANCSPLPEGGATGVAVDSNDDVFITWEDTNSASAIFEYTGNLQSCNYQNINLPVGAGFGLAIDNHSNLLVADGTEIVVSDPPYNSVSKVLASGFSDARTVHLNKANTLAYVSDINVCTVTLLSYPGGSIVKVLHAKKDGLYCPYAAVDSPNAVY